MARISPGLLLHCGFLGHIGTVERMQPARAPKAGQGSPCGVQKMIHIVIGGILLALAVLSMSGPSNNAANTTRTASPTGSRMAPAAPSWPADRSANAR